MQNRFLINFDLDETLAEIAKPMREETVRSIQELTEAGHIVTINSGKPIYYMVGFCRQAGLSDIWLIGENGADLCYGIDLPLRHHQNIGFSEKTINVLARLKQEIRRNFGEKIWFEPTEVILSVFFDRLETKVQLEKFLAARTELFEQENIRIYPFSDCFDITQKDINKGSGVKFLCRKLQIPIERSIAIGDTLNDIPMFEACGHSIIINFNLEAALPVGIKHVATIAEAIEQLKKILNKSNQHYVA